MLNTGDADSVLRSARAFVEADSPEERAEGKAALDEWKASQSASMQELSSEGLDEPSASMCSASMC